jgi:hypothetical protein
MNFSDINLVNAKLNNFLDTELEDIKDNQLSQIYTHPLLDKYKVQS